MSEDWTVIDEFHRHTEAEAQRLANLQADIEEKRAERLVIERLPRTGPWLIRHPRALRLLFRVRPSLRPTLFCVQGSTAATHGTGRDDG